MNEPASVLGLTVSPTDKAIRTRQTVLTKANYDNKLQKMLVCWKHTFQALDRPKHITTGEHINSTRLNSPEWLGNSDMIEARTH